MNRLVHVAALWSLVNHPSRSREWSLQQKMRQIAAAGFTGIFADLTPEHRHLAGKFGIEHLLGGFSAGSPVEYPALIRKQVESGAIHINVQLDDHDTPPRVAVRHWMRLERAAEKIGGVEVSLEIHRDCCTETPEKTYEIADRYHAQTGRLIRLTYDLSHFAVVKHLRPENYSARLLVHPALIQHCTQVHFRPFNGHHAQIPVTLAGELTPEVRAYLGFVHSFLQLWKKGLRSERARTLFACPELGPMRERGAGYSISGFSPAWPDAVRLSTEIAKIWQDSRTLGSK